MKNRFFELYSGTQLTQFLEFIKDNPEWERLSADIAKQTRKLAEGRMSN